jgi:FkbM family methyltransferase
MNKNKTVYRFKLAALVPKHLAIPSRYYYHLFTGVLEPEIKYLPQLIGRRGTAIDVGGYNGEYSFALSRISKSVICFEPQPLLAKSIGLYRNDRIKVYNMGLSEKESTLELRIPLRDGSEDNALASFRKLDGPCKTITVPVRRLDDFHFSDVTLIKIDVEGYESKVISGGVETISREKPILIVEIEQRHLEIMGMQMEDVFNQIEDLGYCGYFLENRILRNLQAFNYDIHQKRYRENPIAGKYINNFIFKPIVRAPINRNHGL